MTYEENNGLRILRPESGMALTNGNVYSEMVYLAIDADKSDWWDTECAEEAEELTAEEALDIIVGGNT